MKYQDNLSGEAVVENWVENPYWQHFSGRQYFEHELPIDPSSMTLWGKRLGEVGAETMLKDIGLNASANAILSATAINFGMLLSFLLALL